MISKKLILILSLGLTPFAAADLSDNSKQMEQEVQQLREENQILRQEIDQLKQEINELFKFKHKIEQVWDRVNISPYMPTIQPGPIRSHIIN